MILPIVKPGIIAGSILVFVPSLGAYVTPRILGGGKQHDDRQFHRVAVRARVATGRLGAVAVGDCCLVIVTAALLIYTRAATGANRDDRPRWPLSARSCSVGMPGFNTPLPWLVFVALYLPIIVLVVYSFNASANRFRIGKSFSACTGMAWPGPMTTVKDATDPVAADLAPWWRRSFRPRWRRWRRLGHHKAQGGSRGRPSSMS